MPASSPKIHPTATVGKECRFGDNVEIGPYCMLDGPVHLGDGVRLLSHVQIHGPAEIGAGTLVYPYVSMGFPPQDVKFKLGMPTAGFKIGRDCQIRENVTIHSATKTDTPTTIGDRCFMMVGCHAGHDARVGDDVVLVNNVLLAGHSHVADRATLGGGCALHQFGRVGRLAFVGGLIAITRDVPPFCLCGARGVLNGINAIGLRRNGVPRDEITQIRAAFREVFRVSMPRKEMVERLRELGGRSPLILEIADFVATSKRSIATAVFDLAETESVD